MRRRKRMLFVLLPCLLGLGFYNYMFFRDRAGRLAGSSAAAPTGKTLIQMPSPVVEGAPSIAVEGKDLVAGGATPQQLGPRNYQEAFLRMAPRAPARAIASPANWAARDIFTHRHAPASPAGTAAAAGAGGGVAPPAVDETASDEKGSIALRVDGWVRTPEAEYAIVNGSLAKGGMRLPTDERILSVARGGVVVSTGQGVQVLPLDGEVADAKLQRTVRSLR